MAYPSTFLRLVASGTLYETEGFSFGLSLIPNFPSEAETRPGAVPQGVIDAYTTLFSSSFVMTRAAVLTTLKLNLIGTDGRYDSEDETIYHDFGATGVSTGTGVRHPGQIAAAITLKTAKSRGLAHAGRFYLPAPNTAVENDGRIDVGDATTLQTAAVLLIDSINASVPGYLVGVASDVRDGAFEAVTSVTVGRVLDTMRSRRTSLDEAYITPVDVAT